MADRWSPLDRAIYGAEDDEEMDMIFDHLDRTMAGTRPDDAQPPGRESESRAEGNESPE